METSPATAARGKRKSSAGDQKWGEIQRAAAAASAEKVQRRRSSRNAEIAVEISSETLSPTRRLFAGGTSKPETHDEWRERMRRQNAEVEAATQAAKDGMRRFNFQGDRWMDFARKLTSKEDIEAFVAQFITSRGGEMTKENMEALLSQVFAGGKSASAPTTVPAPSNNNNTGDELGGGSAALPPPSLGDSDASSPPGAGGGASSALPIEWQNALSKVFIAKAEALARKEAENHPLSGGGAVTTPMEVIFGGVNVVICRNCDRRFDDQSAADEHVRTDHSGGEGDDESSAVVAMSQPTASRIESTLEEADALCKLTGQLLATESERDEALMKSGLVGGGDIGNEGRQDLFPDGDEEEEEEEEKTTQLLEEVQLDDEVEEEVVVEEVAAEAAEAEVATAAGVGSENVREDFAARSKPLMKWHRHAVRRVVSRCWFDVQAMADGGVSILHYAHGNARFGLRSIRCVEITEVDGEPSRWGSSHVNSSGASSSLQRVGVFMIRDDTNDRHYFKAADAAAAATWVAALRR